MKFGQLALMFGTAIGVALAASSADAAVTYTFVADSAYGNSAFGSFVLTVPDYVTGSNILPVDSCSMASSAPPSIYCSLNQFLNADNASYDVVGFQTSSIPNDPGHNVTVYYYFALDAFAADGVYETQLFGADQHATLTVTSTAVPEPASWAMLIGGLGFIGAAMRRRSMTSSVKFA